MEIPVYSDPMIAKLVVHAENREDAMKKMIRAIDDFHIEGIATTLGFGKFVMQHEAFRSGNFDTQFVGKYFTPDKLSQYNEMEELAAVLVAASVLKKAKSKQAETENATPENGAGWRERREKR